ncbi:hypothetical protein TRAPUB_974 [Trametes pubescens]|uniref:Major facilitator superfamily (MFS) profile domain-containing protein n=1 Tax=Trametes pubescens TaxID=154538 RepID=A0A1M2VKI9_TRAPU|nr:hypothetical protein TRAPUB_974 [Trametes pubescens]
MDPSIICVLPADQDAVQNTAPPPADSEKAFESKEVIYSDAEATRPSSLRDVDAAVKTPTMRRKSRIQFATLCWSIFVAGWNDGTIGPLLPRLQEVYHVGYALVSLGFVANCVGFLTGASSYLYLTDRFGFGKVHSAWVAIVKL